MFNMEKFAQLLSGKRREKGLSQGQLAELVGVTHQAVSKWERAEAMPEISKIGDIAKAIGVPADELINTLYNKEETKTQNAKSDNVDEEYFALTDKTRVGDLYALAPKLSKETLQIAIDTLISAKGAGAASMLYQFADREYLAGLANRLFALGDTSLAEYVDESTLKASIVDCITNADICFDNNARMNHYSKAGKLLSYCKDAKFVDDMFEHMTSFLGGRWDVWRNYIGKFPSEVLVKQGIKIAVREGPNCFNSWWDIIGRRNIAKIFIGYVDNFEKNNRRAWEDVARFYNFADGSIMESAIKERLADPEVSPEIFRAVLPHASPELREMLANRGMSGAFNQVRGNAARHAVPNSSANTMANNIQMQIYAKLCERIIESGPEGISEIIRQFGGLSPNFEGTGIDATLSAILQKLEDIESRLDDMEDNLDELECRLGDLE